MNRGAVYSGLIGMLSGLYIKLGGEVFQVNPGWGAIIFGMGSCFLFVACLVIPCLLKNEFDAAFKGVKKIKQIQPEIHPGWNDEYLKASDVYDILGIDRKGGE